MNHEHVHQHRGESAPFHFENCWRVNARAHDVWSVLAQVGDWPQWWPGLSEVIVADDIVEPGSRAQIHVRSPIGLTLRFEIEIRVSDPPNHVSFAADGDLRGSGAWSLDETGPITTITSLWCVTTCRRPIRIMRPIATCMHSLVMSAGHRGLMKRLSELDH